MSIFRNGTAFKHLTVHQLAQHVQARLARHRFGHPAFTLLIGSGFSVPIIPSTKQMVMSDIAWWLYRRERRLSDPFRERPEYKPGLEEFEAKLWEGIRDHCDSSLELAQGVPDSSRMENLIKAYQAIMSAESIVGLADSQSRREYIRDVGRRAGNKINGAHVYLASILTAQENWNNGSPFCRTVFTTNFDPLLQRSLQLVGKLYSLTDFTLGVELPEDDEEDAIHLVYCHGSLHRPFLLNTETEIEQARADAGALVPYLERHGVVVVGYSGWHDILMEALLQCKTFDGNLYWCDIHDPLDAPQKLNADVLSLLRRHRDKAFYVRIPGADSLMLSLHKALGLGNAPSFILDPMGQVIRNLKSVDVSGASAGSLNSQIEGENLAEIRDRSLSRLRAAQEVFKEPDRLIEGCRDASVELKRVAESAVVGQRMNDAFVAATDGDWAAAMEHWTAVIQDDDAPWIERIHALFNRGGGYMARQDWDKAKEDFSAIIRQPGVPDDLLERALIGRVTCHFELDDSDAVLEDCGKILRRKETSAEVKAKALHKQGIIYFGRRSPDAQNLSRAIECFGSAAELAGASSDIKARCLFFRSRCYDILEDFERAISDYDRIIGMPGIPAEQRARVLVERGWKRFYRDPAYARDLLRDATAALEMLPLRVDFQLFRGLALFVSGDAAAAIAQYEMALENDDIHERIWTKGITWILDLLGEGRIQESPELQYVLGRLESRRQRPAEAAAL